MLLSLLNIIFFIPKRLKSVSSFIYNPLFIGSIRTQSFLQFLASATVFGAIFSPLREVSIHITLAYCLEAPPPHLHHGTNAYILIFHKIIYNVSSLHHQNKCARKILQKYHTACITKFFQRLTITQRNSTH